MANATNAASRIGLIKEVVFGTTPNTPQLVAQRFASGGFNTDKPELLDDSKTGSRQYQYTQTGNNSHAGSIAGPFAHDNYDTLLESVFFNTWNTNVLKMGTTRVSLSIEEAQPDISVYQVYRGCMANSWNLEAPIDGLVTNTFELLAMSRTPGAVTIDDNGTYTAQPVRQPFTHCGGTVSEGGSPIAYAGGITLTITNNLSHSFAWGGCSAQDIVEGRVDVTGTLDVYFTSNVMLNKFLNGTESSLSFTMTDGTNNVTVFLPKIKYTGADAPIDSGSGERMISLPFRALYDAVEATTVKITRSA